MDRNELNRRLPLVVGQLVSSVQGEPRTQHLNRIYLPSRDAIIGIIGRLREVVYPGYFGKQGLTNENLAFCLGELVIELSDMLYEQVRYCLRYRQHLPGTNGCGGEECDRKAAEVVAAFLDRLPAVRAMLAGDVQAAFDGDPAARSTDEAIYCYPGLFAITVQRLAHELHALDVPLLPRIMTEYAHGLTGVDIHPGARLGANLFIDHGTGVVIGETTEIGANVKLYQGVTLGALAPHFGQALRGHKRHPTIEDDVIIYAGATILGGETRIGRGSVIGGNVFLTSSVPAYTQVSNEAPRLKFRTRGQKSGQGTDLAVDFQI